MEFRPSSHDAPQNAYAAEFGGGVVVITAFFGLCVKSAHPVIGLRRAVEFRPSRFWRGSEHDYFLLRFEAFPVSAVEV